jgi:hypothetical protein
VILLISASSVARITGVSHEHPAYVWIFDCQRAWILPTFGYYQCFSVQMAFPELCPFILGDLARPQGLALYEMDMKMAPSVSYLKESLIKGGLRSCGREPTRGRAALWGSHSLPREKAPQGCSVERAPGRTCGLGRGQSQARWLEGKPGHWPDLILCPLPSFSPNSYGAWAQTPTPVFPKLWSDSGGYTNEDFSKFSSHVLTPTQYAYMKCLSSLCNKIIINQLFHKCLFLHKAELWI